jgi:hypothetical protein
MAAVSCHDQARFKQVLIQRAVLMCWHL